jgi:hypothetical protein
VIHFGYYLTLSQAYRTGDPSLAHPMMRGTAPLLVDREFLARRVGQPPSEHGLRKQHMQLANSAPQFGFLGLKEMDAVNLRHILPRGGISRPLFKTMCIACEFHTRGERVLGMFAYGTSAIASVRNSGDRPDYNRRVAAARTALGDDAAFDRAWKEGRALGLEQAIALALGETVER